jgi:hypothetical protein
MSDAFNIDQQHADAIYVIFSVAAAQPISHLLAQHFLIVCSTFFDLLLSLGSNDAPVTTYSRPAPFRILSLCVDACF